MLPVSPYFIYFIYNKQLGEKKGNVGLKRLNNIM